MTRFKPVLAALLLLFLGWTAAPGLAADAPAAPAPIQEKDILPYLEQVIAWRRDIISIELSPDNVREALLKDALGQNAEKILHNGFDFARAQAALLDTHAAPAPGDTQPSDQENRHSKLLKSLAATEQHVGDLQAQLNALNASIDKTSARKQAPLLMQREKLEGEWKLAKAQLDLLKSISGVFTAGEGDEAAGLLGKINKLSHSVLDESETQSAAKSSAPETPTAVQEIAAPNSDSMLGLCVGIFTFAHKKSEIDGLAAQTAALQKSNRALIASLRASLQDALKQGANLTTTELTDDPKSLAEYHRSLDALVARYKQLASAVIPLGNTSALLASSLRSLGEWSDLIHEDWSKVFRRLSLRLIVLGVGIVIPLFLSHVAKRATLRYVQDPKRQRQLKTVRRIVLITVLSFVILLNFVTEFGSLATFAGVIAAGLAVAFQTMLISLAAHFFFFGRYGVRAGDRVTVSGVTGDVVQIGMMRLYLQEIKEKDGKFVSTGKIVAFPNSILFQPTAFYKHLDREDTVKPASSAAVEADLFEPKMGE